MRMENDMLLYSNSAVFVEMRFSGVITKGFPHNVNKMSFVLLT